MSTSTSSRGAAGAGRWRRSAPHRRDHGGGEQEAARRGPPASAAPAGQPGDLDAGRGAQGQDVAGRRAPRAARGPAGRPAATRRSRRSPAPPSRRRRPAGTRRRRAGATRSRRSGRGSGRSGRPARPRRRPRPLRPRRRRPGRAVQDEVDVDLARLRPRGRGRCRCGSDSPLLGQRAPLAVPVGAGRAVVDAAAGEREQHLDPLVPAVGCELVEVGAGEGHAQEARAQPLQARHPDGERPVGGDLRVSTVMGPLPVAGRSGRDVLLRPALPCAPSVAHGRGGSRHRDVRPTTRTPRAASRIGRRPSVRSGGGLRASRWRSARPGTAAGRPARWRPAGPRTSRRASPRRAPSPRRPRRCRGRRGRGTPWPRR